MLTLGIKILVRTVGSDNKSRTDLTG